MLEKEIKALINEKVYNAILGEFEWDSSAEQTNHYYISPNNILKKYGITFRVRTINGINKLQIKKHISHEDSLQISEETERDIENVPNSFSKEYVKEMTGIEAPVARIGSLTTLRNSFMFTDGVEICLDKSEYLGITDYEIEVEYTSPIPDELLDNLARLGVDFNKKPVGKFSRFIKKLSEINGW